MCFVFMLHVRTSSLIALHISRTNESCCTVQHLIVFVVGSFEVHGGAYSGEARVVVGSGTDSSMESKNLTRVACIGRMPLLSRLPLKTLDLSENPGSLIMLRAAALA